MNILLLGSGGREHALAWLIKQSPLCNALYVAPGNGGTGSIAQNLSLSVSDFEGIAAHCRALAIDLIVAGSEEPLAKGLKDYLNKLPEFESIKFFGPDALGAKLEGSKSFAKEFMLKHNIPTAKYAAFDNNSISEAMTFLEHLQSPYVLKADGLAAGKGVLICNTLAEAKKECKNMLEGKFGEASKTIVIEEFLDGIEVSVFAITDGNSYVLLPEAKDYKRIGENNTGLNTGGMGSVSPVPFFDDVLKNKIIKRIIEPTISGLKSDQIDYTGFLFFGLMCVAGEPYVIEYNVRLGDPETQSILPRVDGDLLGLIDAACQKKLAEQKQPDFYPHTCVTVILASSGYPGSFEVNKEIEFPVSTLNTHVFHAGTKNIGTDTPKFVTCGGRVMAVVAIGDSLEQAIKLAQQSSNSIHFDGKYFRRDIGMDLK
jgi:phosphoribosylamine--glycine ligase